MNLLQAQMMLRRNLATLKLFHQICTLESKTIQRYVWGDPEKRETQHVLQLESSLGAVLLFFVNSKISPYTALGRIEEDFLLAVVVVIARLGEN